MSLCLFAEAGSGITLATEADNQGEIVMRGMKRRLFLTRTTARLDRPLQRHEHVLLAALFGGAFLYLLLGAIEGELIIPSRRGPDVVMSGMPAWLLVTMPLLFYIGILVRHQNLLPQLSPGHRTVVELSFLWAGICAALLSFLLHADAFCAP